MKIQRLTKIQRFELVEPESEEINPISPTQLLTVRRLKGGIVIKFDSGFYMKVGVRTKMKVTRLPLSGVKRI